MPTETPGSDPRDPPAPPPGARRRRSLQRRPPAWGALLCGAFALGVYAATDTVLRLVSEQSEVRPAAGATPGGVAAPAPSSRPVDAPAPPAPAPAATRPATSPTAPGDSAAADTNVDEAAEGPRRAPPPKSSDEEAPEFRESADNNISLPVDI